MRPELFLVPKSPAAGRKRSGTSVRCPSVNRSDSVSCTPPSIKGKDLFEIIIQRLRGRRRRSAVAFILSKLPSTPSPSGSFNSVYAQPTKKTYARHLLLPDRFFPETCPAKYQRLLYLTHSHPVSPFRPHSWKKTDNIRHQDSTNHPTLAVECHPGGSRNIFAGPYSPPASGSVCRGL